MADILLPNHKRVNYTSQPLLDLRKNAIKVKFTAIILHQLVFV